MLFIVYMVPRESLKFIWKHIPRVLRSGIRNVGRLMGNAQVGGPVGEFQILAELNLFQLPCLCQTS
jgi:hypothetical protein